jgi:hypothetical protein
MESECLLPHTQEPATWLYFEPERSFYAPSHFCKIHFNIILPPVLGLSSGLLS